MRLRAVVPLAGVLILAAALLWLPGWGDAVTWAMAQQRQFHRALAGHLRDLGSGNSLAAWALITASFLYGIFHAAGPGHGKVVIAAYLATHESRLMRGVGLAVAASFCQGLVAVLLVGGLALVGTWLPWETQAAVDWSERLSFVLLAALGALFALRAARRLLAALQPTTTPHVHDDDCACCHHGPSAQQVERADSWRATLGVLLSIGLRPCSGAVLVLVFANVLRLPWAGVAAVAAMSAGTAITVATLALLVVKARHWTAALFRRRAARQGWAGAVVALAGGVVIFLMAASLLVASFGPVHPMRL